MGKCRSTNKYGHPCSARAVNGADYCFMHDPARADEREASRRLGGYHRKRGRDTPFPEVDTRTPAGLVSLVDALMREAWSLENSVHRSRALGYLAYLQKALVESSMLEHRLLALENILKARSDSK